MGTSHMGTGQTTVNDEREWRQDRARGRKPVGPNSGTKKLVRGKKTIRRGGRQKVSAEWKKGGEKKKKARIPIEQQAIRTRKKGKIRHCRGARNGDDQQAAIKSHNPPKIAPQHQKKRREK